MRALLLTDFGPTLSFNHPSPKPAPGEALIRVQLAGICSTDLQLMRGYKRGFRGVLGHEFVGEVVDAPEYPQWIGRRVVGEINVGCGECELCQRGLGKHCRSRSSLGIIRRDGAFADYLTLPVANLLTVPDAVSDEAAVFTEPLAAALQLLEQYPLRPRERVYVLGDGRLGLLVVQVLARIGAEIVALGRNDNKLAILAERGIATVRIDDRAKMTTLLAHPADLVIEVTGSPAGFELARRLVRPRGTLALKSTFADGLTHFDISSLVVDEITLLGSRCGPFAPALRLLAEDAIAVEPLIHARYPLDEGLAALHHAGQKGVLKVLITVSP
ncbi:MAG: alcohol dehydrogenase catalytic domain-containing protein [Caldilineaceae bacterium]|nr:alcohol dehydrogenase catalytic domain-containing protein [Caldilineaceae bacterium]